MNSKKVWKMISQICSVIGLISIVWSWATYGSFVNAAWSVKQLDDHFYYMEFNGDTQLDDFLERGGAETNAQMGQYIEFLLRGKRINKVYKEQVPLNTGCAAIGAVSPDGDQLFGRNFDWLDVRNVVIMKSNPTHGYKSISTVLMDFIGFGDEYTLDTFGHKYLATAGLFVPLDGMNEKGLCISDLMAGDAEVTDQDNGKNDVTTTLAIRAILDFCADVPEAIEFLENHDMHSVIGNAHHFAIRDAAGRMVVAEYVDNRLVITEADAVTNHYLGKEMDLTDRQNSVERLSVLQSYLDENENLTEEQMRSALYDIRASQYGDNAIYGGKTQWRIVFNQTDLTVQYSLAENYSEDASRTFKL